MKFRHGLTIATTLLMVATAAIGTTSVFADTVNTEASNTDNIDTSAVVTKYQTAQNTVARINGQISNKIVEIQVAEKNLDKLNARISKNEKEVKKTTKEYNVRKSAMTKQLISLQKEQGNTVTGNVYVDYLLDSSSLSDAAGRISTIARLNSANNKALEEVSQSQKKLDQLSKDLSLDRQAAIASTAKLKADKKSLEGQKKVAMKASQELQTKLAAANAVKAANAAKSKKTDKSQASASQAPAAAKSGASTPSGNSFKPGNVKANGLAGTALQFRGVPYVWGGSTPAGFDCSGLVAYSAQLNGISLPRTSQAMSALGPHVSLSSLKTGDLVFWGASAYHVGIYIGNGQYVHAPAPGQNVKVQSFSEWSPEYGIHL